MSTKEKIDTLRGVAENLRNADFRLQYSGRGMFGRYCPAIDCDDYTECIEAAAAKGVTGACWDSMGKGYIVYWPGIDTTDLNEEYNEDA